MWLHVVQAEQSENRLRKQLFVTSKENWQHGTTKHCCCFCEILPEEFVGSCQQIVRNKNKIVRHTNKLLCNTMLTFFLFFASYKQLLRYGFHLCEDERSTYFLFFSAPNSRPAVFEVVIS